MGMSPEEEAWREAAGADLREDDHEYTVEEVREAAQHDDHVAHLDYDPPARRPAHFDPEEIDFS